MTRPGLGLLTAVFLLAGIAHWLLLFGLAEGGPTFQHGDWPKEFRYYSALKQAVTEGRVPYYVSRPIHETRKLLALPEVSWSPQVVLLRWLDVRWFVAANTALLHGAGLAGCVLLTRRLGLSAAPAALLALVLLFNGHLVAHVAIGHSMWAGFLLLPFFVLAVLGALDERPAPGRAPAIGLVLFALLLQGAFHVFVWCVLFLLVLAVHRRPRRIAAAALVWAAFLGACRLVPAAVALVGRREQPFFSGYPGLLDLVAALVVVRGPATEARGLVEPLGWWEYDLYVGPAAAAWLAWAAFRRWQSRAGRPWPELDVTLLVLAALSLGYAYYPINALGVPLLGSQRVSSRLLALPIVFGAVLAARETESFLRRPGGSRKRLALVAGAAAATAVALALHSWAWRAPAVERALPPSPHPRDLEIRLQAPGEAPEGVRDRAYVTAVRWSAFVSLAAIGAAAWRLRSGRAALAAPERPAAAQG